VNSHIIMYQQQVTQQAVGQLAAEVAMSGQQMSPEQVIALAIGQTSQTLSGQLAPVLQQISVIQQEIQKRTPPPPMPPEVQASLKIAEMENTRRTQMDQATLAMKGQEQQLKQQAESVRFQADQAKVQFEQQLAASQQQFEQFMAAQQQQADTRAEEMTNQIKMLINEQDNKHKQMTELLKNHEDNQTEIFIAQMEKQLSALPALQQPQESATVDNSSQLQQVQMMLDQLSKQQTNDSLTSIMSGLQATIEHLGKPKMIVRDGSGKAVGVKSAE